MSKKIKCPNCGAGFIPTLATAAATTADCPSCHAAVDLTADTIGASALAALPAIGSDGALPADIQVFPPGRGVKFTLQDFPGQEFELDVDASTADVLNNDLQARLARARAGEASMPYADKNHEDAEATLTPVRYFYAGEDKVKGGVRLEAKWNEFGGALARAGAFRYFSQNFLFSKGRKRVLGLINENVGGLVNRPGFATQAAFAKAAASLTTNQNENMTTEEFKKIVDDALKPVVDKVTALEAKAKGAEPAVEAKAAADKTITDAITLALKPVTDQLTEMKTQHRDTLKAQAKSAVAKYVGRIGLAPQDAKAIEFYEKSYLADPATTEEILGKLPARAGGSRMTTSDGGGTQTITSTEPEDVFMAKAKAFGKDNKLDDGDAVIAFARTAEGAGLYEDFRQKVNSASARK